MSEPKRAEKPAVLLVMLPRDDGGCDVIEGTVLVSFATEAQARRFVIGASMDPNSHDRVATIPSDKYGPDLQLFIKQCGARGAHAIGEHYDPKVGGTAVTGISRPRIGGRGTRRSRAGKWNAAPTSLEIEI